MAKVESLPGKYVISQVWIGPLEGYEFQLRLMGTTKVLAYRKSYKAAVNAATKHQAGKLKD